MAPSQELFLRFESFMVSRRGRWTRGLLGLGLIAGGFFARKRTKAAVVATGSLPLIAAVGDLCLLGPLFGKPWKGKEMRRTLRHERVAHLPYPKEVDLEPAFE